MTTVRIVFLVIVLAAVALLVWKFVLDADDEPDRTLTFVIGDHPGNPSKCRIKAGDGTEEVIAYPGEYVKFRNETSVPRTIIFGTTRKLFAEPSKTFAPGATDSLQVLADAAADGRKNPHKFKSCADDVAPPVLIVCPPGSNCS